MSRPSVLLYLFGPPACGKTTLLRVFLRQWPVLQTYTQPFAHELRAAPTPDWPIHDCLVLGSSRPGPFGGTDALGQGVGQAAIAWIALRPFPRILAEGDRLAFDGFWRAAQRAGYTLLPVLLDCPPEVLAARRVHRATITRTSPQQAAWLAGRATKAQRLADEWDAIRLDATLPPADLADRLALLLGSVGRATEAARA